MAGTFRLVTARSSLKRLFVARWIALQNPLQFVPNR